MTVSCLTSPLAKSMPVVGMGIIMVVSVVSSTLALRAEAATVLINTFGIQCRHLTKSARTQHIRIVADLYFYVRAVAMAGPVYDLLVPIMPLPCCSGESK